MTIEREMLYQAFLAEKKFEKCSVKWVYTANNKGEKKIPREMLEFHHS